MRCLVLIALLLSTAACRHSMWGRAELSAHIMELQREELEALRVSAGLTHDQFMAEMRRLDPEWYRATERKRIYKEARDRNPPPHKAGVMQDSYLPPDLRAEVNAFPKGKTRWDMQQLLYRARRLEAGATEEEVLRELKAKYPHWKGG